MLRRAYRVLHAAGVVALLVLGLMAWLGATSGNGLGLVALLAWAAAAVVAVRGRASRVLPTPGPDPSGDRAIDVRVEPVVVTLGPGELERARRLRAAGSTLVEIAEALRPAHAADPATARGALLSALERVLDGS
ncbi:MAG: hypothetical protein KY453_07855 [Gemmatimonadetes bacterium]|nr:hypothetical protein [Gemmatimonadota bacterium]